MYFCTGYGTGSELNSSRKSKIIGITGEYTNSSCKSKIICITVPGSALTPVQKVKKYITLSESTLTLVPKVKNYITVPESVHYSNSRPIR